MLNLYILPFFFWIKSNPCCPPGNDAEELFRHRGAGLWGPPSKGCNSTPNLVPCKKVLPVLPKSPHHDHQIHKYGAHLWGCRRECPHRWLVPLPRKLGLRHRLCMQFPSNMSKQRIGMKTWKFKKLWKINRHISSNQRNINLEFHGFLHIDDAIIACGVLYGQLTFHGPPPMQAPTTAKVDQQWARESFRLRGGWIRIRQCCKQKPICTCICIPLGIQNHP